MKLLRSIVFLLLALTAAREATAQTTYALSPPSKIPWNNYVPSRIANNFTSIIGNGGTLVPLTNTAFNGYEYPVTLPFNFLFLNTTYPAGYTLRVGTNGYLAFNGTTFTGNAGAYYGNTFASVAAGNARGYYNRMILAHATAIDMRPPVSDGGVYWAVSGTAPNRVFTIEWRGALVFYTTRVGNFQLKLYEDLHTGNSVVHAFYFKYLLPIWFDVQVIEQAAGTGPAKRWRYG